MSHVPAIEVQALLHTALNEGGATRYLTSTARTQRYVIGDGRLGLQFKVEDIKAELDYVHSTIDRDSLTTYLTHVIRYWESKGFGTVGTWVEDGVLYLDPGNTTNDEGAAKQLGLQRGELAIWDSKESKTIYLG